MQNVSRLLSLRLSFNKGRSPLEGTTGECFVHLDFNISQTIDILKVPSNYLYFNVYEGEISSLKQKIEVGNYSSSLFLSSNMSSKAIKLIDSPGLVDIS